MGTMNEVWVYSLLSVIVVSLISLVGVVTLSIGNKRLKSLLIYMISFAAGALFGDAFIHLLPQAVATLGFGIKVSLLVVGGIMLSFIIEKVICWRHCHLPITAEHTHPFALMNLVGDSVHNFIDGVIIGASYLVSVPVGFATTLAIILHEIPQEMADFGVLLHGGFSKGRALFMNFITALTALLGAILALLIGSFSAAVVDYAVPIGAGMFIYIAGSDLIPELHKEVEVKRSILQIITFALGTCVMLLLLLVT